MKNFFLANKYLESIFYFSVFSHIENFNFFTPYSIIKTVLFIE